MRVGVSRRNEHLRSLFAYQSLYTVGESREVKPGKLTKRSHVHFDDIYIGHSCPIIQLASREEEAKIKLSY
jgi:hypothetical protein